MNPAQPPKTYSLNPTEFSASSARDRREPGTAATDVRRAARYRNLWKGFSGKSVGSCTFVVVLGLLERCFQGDWRPGQGTQTPTSPSLFPRRSKAHGHGSVAKRRMCRASKQHGCRKERWPATECLCRSSLINRRIVQSLIRDTSTLDSEP